LGGMDGNAGVCDWTIPGAAVKRSVTSSMLIVRIAFLKSPASLAPA
jgi:hypothetical protein